MMFATTASFNGAAVRYRGKDARVVRLKLVGGASMGPR